MAITNYLLHIRSGSRADFMPVVSDLGGYQLALRLRLLGCGLPHLRTGSASRTKFISRLNALPARSAVNASPAPLRASAHDSGTMGGWGLLPYGCTFPNPQFGVTLVNLQGGLRTRVAIAWIADTAAAGYPNAPSADINLEVRSPNGVSFWSSSFDGTYEIVDFVTPVAGNYSLYLWRRNCASVPGGAVAYAYWQAH